jgi:hypothetical protein
MEFLKMGDVLLTRNTEEVGNNTPGYWNHAAICASMTRVVEAQSSEGVICVPLSKFWLRYPEILVVRNYVVAMDMAYEARCHVGAKYHKYASMFSWFKRWQPTNCVGLIRECYYNVTGRDPKWKVPDHIIQSKLFFKVDHKKDYDNWIKPDQWFEDALDYWPG